MTLAPYTLPSALSVMPASRSLAMKCYLSLQRRNGTRLAVPTPEMRRRLVTVTMASASGYRVVSAKCCQGGSTVATLYEPTLIRVSDDAFLFQGFEKVGEQGTVQEWVLEPHCVGKAP